MRLSPCGLSPNLEQAKSLQTFPAGSCKWVRAGGWARGLARGAASLWPLLANHRPAPPLGLERGPAARCSRPPSRPASWLVLRDPVGVAAGRLWLAARFMCWQQECTFVLCWRGGGGQTGCRPALPRPDLLQTGCPAHLLDTSTSPSGHPSPRSSLQPAADTVIQLAT